MNHGNQKVTEDELQRFVDGELGEAQAERLSAVLASDEALGRKAADYREINRRLGEIYDEKTQGPIPARLLLAASGRSGSPLWHVAAAVLWLGVGAIIGFSLQNQRDADGFLRPLPVEAAFAHAVYVPEVRHPVEVGASEQEHLNAWLSKRLDRPIAAPDLRPAGYALIGGRLLPDGHRPAAQFMFEDATGQRITLYIRHALDTRETSFLHAEKAGLGIVYWVDNGLAYALTAATGKDDLTETAKIVYREVNP
ncbi:MAG: anti-sigma factor [Gammaproteobacteria bacterium]|nr:anti-sigma factor [Gammaproteobacteria bacterium]